MIPFIKTNYGMKGSCPLCGQADSTEHVFLCGHTDSEVDVDVSDLEKGERMVQIVRLFNKTKDEREKKMRIDVDEEIDTFLKLKDTECEQQKS
jgi:hypothetical protein